MANRPFCAAAVCCVSTYLLNPNRHNVSPLGLILPLVFMVSTGASYCSAAQLFVVHPATLLGLVGSLGPSSRNLCRFTEDSLSRPDGFASMAYQSILRIRLPVDRRHAARLLGACRNLGQHRV